MSFGGRPDGHEPVAAGLETGLDEPADYILHLGLERDPFEPSDSLFFAGANRQQLLEQLLHLCQFSASAVAVLGEQGVGKSALKRELLSHLSSSDDVCLVDVPPSNNGEEILRQIVRGFGLRCDNSASRGQLLSEIRHFGQSGEEGALALMIIENAHNLNDQILGALFSLLQGQEESVRRLHILLFGEPRLGERLDQFGIVDVLIHDLHLEPFTPEEVAQYLQFRLELVGYQGELPFSEEDIQSLWQESRGLPGALHKPAREYLKALAVQPPEPAERPSGLPLGHLLAVVLLMAGLLLALFYRAEWGAESETKISQPVAVKIAPVQPSAPTASQYKEPSASEHEEPPVSESKEPTAFGHEEAPVIENQEPSAVSNYEPSAVSNYEPSAITNHESSVSAGQESFAADSGELSALADNLPPASGAKETSAFNSSEPSISGNPELLPSETEEPSKAENKQGYSPSNSQKPPVAGGQNAFTPEVGKPPVPHVGSAPPVKPGPSVAQDPAATGTLVTGGEAGLTGDELVLLARDKTSYTLQVLAAGSRAGVESFIGRQANKDQLRVFNTRRKGSDWFVVVVGDFPDAEAARKAIADLPLEQRRAGPWPRSLAGIQADIRTYRGI